MDFTLAQICWLIFAAVALVLIVKTALRYGITPALFRAGPQMQASLLMAARIKRHWPELATQLRLGASSTGQKWDGRRKAFVTVSKTVVPHLATTADDYGVRLRVTLVPGVGADEFTRHRQHLADAWRAVRVSVEQASAGGTLTLRAIRHDPLAVKTERILTDEQLRTPPADIREIVIGTDEYASPVPLRLGEISGITVNGLPGYGKSSLANLVLTSLAPHPAVQFGVLNGKGDGEYDDAEPRLLFHIGDDLKQANDVLKAWTELRRWRAANIRKVLGVKNFWHVGPSVEWPLLMLLVDECHTYLQQVKDGGNKLLRERNAFASENALLLEDGVKKGRSLGMTHLLLTQKGTGDAIPTSIRDNCAVGISFALRTDEAAVAALGADIRHYPDANPVSLQDPAYIGVCTMVVQGRPGFTRVRIPYVREEALARSAELNAHLTARPRELTAAGLVLALSPSRTYEPAALGVSEPDDVDE